jgi:hypothetical protein
VSQLRGKLQRSRLDKKQHKSRNGTNPLLLFFFFIMSLSRFLSFVIGDKELSRWANISWFLTIPVQDRTRVAEIVAVLRTKIQAATLKNAMFVFHVFPPPSKKSKNAPRNAEHLCSMSTLLFKS